MELGRMNSTISKLFFSALMVGLAACSPVKFDANKADGQAVTPTGEPPTPTPVPCNVETIYRPTKILFVTDMSGSNVDRTVNYINGQVVETDPTDPVKEFRYNAISDFVNTFRSKSNFDWGFITFQGTTASSAMSGFTDVNQMNSVLGNFRNQRDEGKTPYRAALARARAMIANDPELNVADKPNYVVVFLSDGFPTDNCSGTSCPTAPVEDDVRSLVNVAGAGRVTLSTILYGGPRTLTDAEKLLKTMSSIGRGQYAYVNTQNRSSGFKIDDVIGQTACNQ